MFFVQLIVREKSFESRVFQIRPNHYKKDLAKLQRGWAQISVTNKTNSEIRESKSRVFRERVCRGRREGERAERTKSACIQFYTSPHRNRKHHANLTVNKIRRTSSHYVVIKSLSRLAGVVVLAGKRWQ